MVFVTTADGSKGLVGVSYSAMKEDMRGTVRDVRKKLEGIDVLASASAASDKPSDAAATEVAAASGAESQKESGLFAESQEWTNSAGQTITAAINKIEGGTVQFLMPNGKYVDYPLAKLSNASQEKIKSLQ